MISSQLIIKRSKGSLVRCVAYRLERLLLQRIQERVLLLDRERLENLGPIDAHIRPHCQHAKQ